MIGKRLEGKVAIITGSSSGIGAAAMKLFASEGASVIGADLEKESGERVVSEVEDNGGVATFLCVDVSSASDVESMIGAAVSSYGKLDILFNNAGINKSGNVVEQSEEDWNRIIAVNLNGAYLGMKYAIPVMLENGGGSIVNTASAFSHTGSARHSAYSAAKGGVLTLSYSTAAAFADRNIRVNCVSPGFIETGMSIRNRNIDDIRALMAPRIPQGRMGKPEEVANAALFLASDEASHITGTFINVDGGYLATGR